MRNSSLSNIVSGVYSQSIAIIIGGITTLAAYFLGKEILSHASYPLICDAIQSFSTTRIGAYCLHFAEIAVSALSLSYMTYSRNVIRTRSKLPGIFLLLFCCNYPAYFLGLSTGTFITIVFAVIFLILFSPSTEFRLPLHIYIISFFLSAAGILYPSLFLYIPLFWLGSAKIASFGFKCLLASFLGVITPFWLLGATQMVWDFSFCFQNFIDNFYPFHFIDYRHVSPSLIYTAAVTIIGFFCWIRNTALQYEDKIITRIYNGIINMLFFYTLVLICLNYNGFPAYLPILNVCVSLQAAHYFTHANSKHAAFLFYTIITVFILFFLWNLLQDLVNGAI